MGTSVLHIKTEVECRVYLFDEEKGIAKPGIYFNLEVRKGEQDLLFVSTEDELVRYQLLYVVEENDCDYRLTLERSQFKFKQDFQEVNTAKATDEEIANGVKDRYGVVYSADGTELLKYHGYSLSLNTYHVKEGCKVIRGGAFFWEHLTAISLPSSITHIGNSAFSLCKNLTAITLPVGLTHIGDGAFARSGIRSVVNHSPHFIIQDGFLIDVQDMRLIAFLSNDKDVTLPAGLTHIGDSTFWCCKNLNAITLPASLTHIGDSAFRGCKNLTAITLPASLTHIGEGAFVRSGIRSVVNHSPHFKFQDGCLIDVQGKRLIAFLSDDEEVALPAGLLYVGDSAFSGCENLTAITLPDSFTHIVDSAFQNCKNLTAITLPDGLTHIGERAFWGCDNLTAITLPAGLTHIGDGAFACTGIRSVVNLSPHLKFQDGCLMEVQGKRLIAFLSDDKDVTLPAGLTHIGDSAFFDCKNLIAITLPAGLTHIGDSAFLDCKNLTAITLPDGLTHLGGRAFSYCDNLTAITLPASLTHIGDNAFFCCKNLAAITLPASLTHIGDDAFALCINLITIHVPQGMTEHFKALLPDELHSSLKEQEPEDSREMAKV